MINPAHEIMPEGSLFSANFDGLSQQSSCCRLGICIDWEFVQYTLAKLEDGYVVDVFPNPLPVLRRRPYHVLQTFQLTERRYPTICCGKLFLKNKTRSE